MANKKVKRFYVMPEVWVTVTNSQVFNWIKHLSKKGINTDCVSITDSKLSKNEVERIESEIKSNFIQIHNPKRLIVNDIYFTFFFLKLYFKNVFKYDKIIFQTRLSSLGVPFLILKLFPKVRLIFESRGAGSAERDHVEKRKGTLKERIKTFSSETSEKMMLKTPNKIICVSNALKKYYIDRFNIKNKDFIIFPGAADSELFYLDSKLRLKGREEFELLDEDILVVYSGRLEMKWEIPDKIFEFFKSLYIKNNNFKLLLITPDTEIANNFMVKYDLANVCFSKSVKLEEVNKYLNSADVGILLRENVPMNNVASPTKFAEYLMSGLPVIISSGIHDFAKSIKASNYGVVVEGLDEISEDEYQKLKNSLIIEKKEIASYGRKSFSKEVYINEYHKLLNNI